MCRAFALAPASRCAWQHGARTFAVWWLGAAPSSVQRSGRIFQPSWYLRRFRGGGREFGDLARGLLRRLRRKPATAGNPFLADTDALLRAKRPVLFVYGQRDNLPLREFRERHATIPADLAAPQAVQVIDHATHTFNSLDSQAAVIACTAEWLLGRR
jgi:pimeloyl-ACP methyl ester carboxylesterase